MEVPWGQPMGASLINGFPGGGSRRVSGVFQVPHAPSLGSPSARSERKEGVSQILDYLLPSTDFIRVYGVPQYLATWEALGLKTQRLYHPSPRLSGISYFAWRYKFRNVVTPNRRQGYQTSDKEMWKSPLRASLGLQPWENHQVANCGAEKLNASDVNDQTAKKRCLKSEITIENGFFSESEFAIPLNKETKYKCKTGYVTPGGKTSGSITCLESGWSPQPTCIKSCDMPVLENATIKSNSTWFKVNDTLDYECHDGFESRDGHTGSIVCGNDGWSYKPECYDSEGKCGPPPRIDNGDITSFTLLSYAPGSSVEYICQSFYVLQGHRTITCRNGQWSPPPKCLEACTVSADILRKHNIRLRWSHETKIYSRTGDVIEFECLHGYRRKTPDHTF
ncbi:complement factor H-related protein 4-like [Lontra canadensis]|uniref:complement factor H-related protein 4-like n=1 Tax=Lontra canadensis TaxID=76717 RepID=UPI0013F32E07|nr:complement factor H-related protein 4-like [Lontra canadensis]